MARYTDDTWMALARVGDWPTRIDAYAEALSRLGLGLNDEKTSLHEKVWDDPWSVVNDGLLDSLTAGERSVPPGEARELLEAQVTSEERNWRVIRFALGTLRRTCDPAGLEAIYENPELLDEEPVTVGNYLCSIGRHGRARKAIDHDWLVERAVSDRGRRGLAGRLHAARACVSLKVGKKHGRDLFDVATRQEMDRQVPLTIWATCAWGQSGDFKQTKAIEAAHAYGTFSLRRGFCLPLLHRPVARRARTGLKSLTRIEPDLVPTVAAIERHSEGFHLHGPSMSSSSGHR